MLNDFRPDEDFGRELDAADPLRSFRDRFHIPRQANGQPVHYFTGNSLGLQPVTTREAVIEELDAWQRLAVDAHFEGAHPWFPYHENFRESGARIVGAQPGEVVMMNGLSVNLHLLMVSFYRPTKARHAIMMEAPAFPSDTYAAQTQLQFHGHDPATSLLRLEPREGEQTLRTDDIIARIARDGDRTALLLLAGVNFLTGQFFELAPIVQAAHAQGVVVGLDLAHAAGNVPLQLHDLGVDFAAWCTYKYLNSGPGAVAGAFVHQRHAADTSLPRFGGWWGNDPATRFRMQLEERFVAKPDADGWQLSNPPIMAMAPMRASFAIFDEAGMPALRQKSLKLTAYLEQLIDRIGTSIVQIATPRDPAQRGCQLSLRITDRPKERRKALQSAGVVCDFREPDIIRAAPVPLYNSFHDVWRFAHALAALK
ncbi:MAG: kynureninase [Planctomycetota bacterium]